MKAYLVYHREEAVKNQGFLNLFREAGGECGMDFSYVPYDAYKQRELPDFVLNRTRDREVSRWYEERRVPVFHSSFLTEIGNHKGKTLAFLRGRLPEKILRTKWAPETLAVSKERLAQWQSALAAGDLEALHEVRRFQEEGEPFVMKSVDGHGGSEVLSFVPFSGADSGITLQQYCLDFNRRLGVLFGKDCLLQEMVSGSGRDIRVYVVGNRIYQAMLRQGQGDFRSNASLGGRAGAYSLSESEKEYIGQFLQAFEGEVLGLAGLDFIIADDGRLVFNELEEMAGCRMIYQNTGRDIVRDYVMWLRDCPQITGRVNKIHLAEMEDSNGI